MQGKCHLKGGANAFLVAGPAHSMAIPCFIPSMAAPSIASALRRSLLIKIISKPQPSKEDVASVIELTASKVVEALQAQSMTLYLVEGNDIAFKQIYYSPSLWSDDPKKEEKFKEMEAKLLQLEVPVGTGIVGKVIQTGAARLLPEHGEPGAHDGLAMAKTTGFEVKSMLTVPLKTTITLGAIQTLNKEFSAGTNGEFTEADLKLLTEVAEYSAALIHRMIDPKFQLGPGRHRAVRLEAHRPAAGHQDRGAGDRR